MAFQSTPHVTRCPPFEEEADENGFFLVNRQQRRQPIEDVSRVFFFFSNIYAVMKMMFVTQTHATMAESVVVCLSIFPFFSLHLRKKKSPRPQIPAGFYSFLSDAVVAL